MTTSEVGVAGSRRRHNGNAVLMELLHTKRESDPLKRIFTKTFFRLSPDDQAAVVDSVIDDIERAIPMMPDKNDRRRAKRTVRRIEKKAIEYGIYGE